MRTIVPSDMIKSKSHPNEYKSVYCLDVSTSCWNLTHLWLNILYLVTTCDITVNDALYGILLDCEFKQVRYCFFYYA